MRAAIYACSAQVNHVALESQINVCQEFAQQNGWEILSEHIFVDDGFSGLSVEGRPALNALIKAAKSIERPFNYVVIENVSRLGGNMVELLRISETLHEIGVCVYFVGERIDTRDNSSHLFLYLYWLADTKCSFERGKRVHRGQQSKVLNGLVPGGKSYGYLNVRVTPNVNGATMHGVQQQIREEEALVVRRIYEAYARGQHPNSIAEELNRDGIPSPTPELGPWKAFTIHSILRKEKYCGVLVWNRTKKVMFPDSGRKVSVPRPRDEWICVEVPSLALVTKELWSYVASIRVARCHKPISAAFDLSGDAQKSSSGKSGLTNDTAPSVSEHPVQQSRNTPSDLNSASGNTPVETSPEGAVGEASESGFEHCSSKDSDGANNPEYDPEQQGE